MLSQLAFVKKYYKIAVMEACHLDGIALSHYISFQYPLGNLI